MKTFLFSIVLASMSTGCALDDGTTGRAAGDKGTIIPPSPFGDAELHVVGIYDPYSAEKNVQGPAHVHIDRPGRIVLFLSSYSRTDWTVTAGADTTLVSVIAHGYEAQTIAAPAGVQTTTLSAQTDNVFLGCGYEYPDQDPMSGCETPALLAGVARYTSKPVTSFHGCYAASDFLIPADLQSSSDCAVRLGYAHTSVVQPEYPGPVQSPMGEPEPSSNGCSGKQGLGHYEGFFCERQLYPNSGPFILTDSISCKDALANCELNASANPMLSIRCTWNGDVVYLSERQPNACMP